ncbi:MAG: hypothetical protein BGN86_17180 [Caulobacterales bacterium 68-7]|nr:MAG: hypothetical protein BGN86_17180 [Caulobacterales bacterium 68-7]
MTDRSRAFIDSLGAASPPSGTPRLAVAIWHGLRGEWQAAHDIAEADHTRDGSWVHAWLHRIEGDLSNAGYWYRLANKPKASDSTRDEGERIARALLAG